MASAFSVSLMPSGGMETPPLKISGTTIGTTMEFSPDVGIYQEAQNQKKIDMNCLVCKLQTAIPKIPIFGNAIFW